VARRILILLAAIALAAEAAGALFVMLAFYGFVAFGNGMKFGPAGPGALKTVVVILNIGLALFYATGAVIMLLAAFGVVLNAFMQGTMMGIAALQLFLTIVVTGLTGVTQLLVLGGVFVLLSGALAVTMVTPSPGKPEPGPVEPATGS
jgi:hypothetical protein